MSTAMKIYLFGGIIVICLILLLLILFKSVIFKLLGISPRSRYAFMNQNSKAVFRHRKNKYRDATKKYQRQQRREARRMGKVSRRRKKHR